MTVKSAFLTALEIINGDVTESVYFTPSKQNQLEIISSTLRPMFVNWFENNFIVKNVTEWWSEKESIKINLEQYKQLHDFKRKIFTIQWLADVLHGQNIDFITIDHRGACGSSYEVNGHMFLTEEF